MFRNTMLSVIMARCVLLFPLLFAAAAPLRAEETFSARFSDYAALAAGPQQTVLLPGQDGVVFTMYGAPGEVDALRELASVMREEGLGNGFDPGPGPYPAAQPAINEIAEIGWPLVAYPGGDMQIKGGRGPLGKENAAVLEVMERAGVFNAVQLGEWGYYFHNLSQDERWWREVFGTDFDAYRHLMKPQGLAGYDRRPETKRECYEVLKDYFMSKSGDLLDRVMSVTGHSHYEAYAGEWGARCIGLEVGENIAFTQSKLAFARGASRQWKKPWSVQISPWMHGACTTSGPLRMEAGGARGLDAGHSLSFYERMWLHAWFAGAAMVTPENSIAIFFEKAEAPWTLTSHGRKGAEVFALMRQHDRGVPYTPMVIVLDHLAGYNGFMDKPWGILTPTDGDQELRDLFDWQLFPGSDHIRGQGDPDNPEAGYLCATPYGEMFDVVLTNASRELLSAYPVILLAGDIVFDDAFVSVLEHALKSGSRVLMAPRHRDALGKRYGALSRHGRIEALETWMNPATGRSAAISKDALALLCRELLPIRVMGDDIQYQINRTPDSWVVELINNRGVAKHKDQPAVTDLTASVQARLEPRVRCSVIREWRSGRVHETRSHVTVEVGPGAVEFVEFVLSD